MRVFTTACATVVKAARAEGLTISRVIGCRRRLLMQRAATPMRDRCTARVAHASCARTGTGRARDPRQNQTPSNELAKLLRRAPHPRSAKHDKNKIYSVHEPAVEVHRQGRRQAVRLATGQRSGEQSWRMVRRSKGALREVHDGHTLAHR